MSDSSRIEWTEATWNPVTGCSKVSLGCKNCYALREWPRLSAPRAKPNVYTGREFADVRCHSERLDQPLHWKKPRRIFVNSMSDLFHDSVREDFILAVFVTMAAASQHTYQVLTKRPARMLDLLTRWKSAGLVLREGCGATLRNVWLGVSVEDQTTADERIPLLLRTPAAVRWLSAEPLLGPIGLEAHLAVRRVYGDRFYDAEHGPGGGMLTRLNWVVAGGESGPAARPSHPDWFRSMRDQCRVAALPFFFKQWGQWIHEAQMLQDGTNVVDRYALDQGGTLSAIHEWPGEQSDFSVRIPKRAAGRLLDGVEYNEYPA